MTAQPSPDLNSAEDPMQPQDTASGAAGSSPMIATLLRSKWFTLIDLLFLFAFGLASLCLFLMPGFLCDLCLHGDFLQAVVMAWRTPFYLLVDSVFWLLFSVVLFTVLELFDLPHLTRP